MNVVLFNEYFDPLFYQGAQIILFYLTPILILSVLAGRKSKNLFIFGILTVSISSSYFFLRDLYVPITQINYISLSEGILTARNSINNVIYSSPIEKVRFYCIYTISNRRNKFYDKAGLETNNQIYHFSLKRNCDEFQSRSKKVNLAMKYAEKDSFPEIENEETKNLILQGLFVIAGVIILLIVNRKFPI